MRFEIVRNRKWFFLLSGTITIAGLIVMLLRGLNLGTDFVSGTRVQIDLNQPFSSADMITVFQNAGLAVTPSEVTAAGIHNDVAIVRLKQKIGNADEQKLKAAIGRKYPRAQLQIESVEPVVAREISKNAIYAVLLASLFIVVYIAIRFEYRFAVSGIIALLHDAFIVVSVFALLRLEVDLPFIAAVLTIVGYSINDTIVIFDRIRENLKAAKKVKTMADLEDLVNTSVWQTMTRSINTVLTVLFAAVTLFLFGSPSIHNFSFALMIGLVSGAYSSIFIASPIWVVWRSRNRKRAKQPAGKSQ
jgi:preprotein translocase subunit SecF